MNDSDVGNALRRLPRTTASHHFKHDVMRALDRKAGRISIRPGWLTPAFRFMAVASVMLILAAGVYGTSIHRQRERIKALRAEQQQIESELQRVKVASQAQPVVVLENGDTRVIVDMKQDQQTNPTYY